MPYIYTLAHQAAATGMPMAGAMAIDHQDLPQAYTHDLQYMWGPSLLVAPVTSDGGGVQKIWLPAGTDWYNFWWDGHHTGSDTEDVLRYANGGNGDRPVTVDVDGKKAGALDLPPTGSWDTWAAASVTADLPKGDSVTVHAILTQSQGANIDSLTVQ
ncbi:hypothetical protein ACFWVU_29450 [Streptomyces sp. NPDC058686]|uniref:hypothetical protein n=1 Tax=Streptomyces sp. NPDC058686 TaxID=3346599 RepID=UPI0036697B70